MAFGRQDQDDEVIRLLGQLRDSGPEYPSSLFSKRRAAVMAAFAALNLGAATAGLTLLGHLVKIVKGMGVVEKIVLGVEVAAVTGMTAYGAVTAYKYRYEIQQVLQSNLGIATSTPWPSLVAPVAGGGATELAETGTATATPSPTPTGTWYPPTQDGGGPVVGQPTQPSSTPPPVAQSTPTPPQNCGLQGICKGWTKTPKPSKTP